MIDNRSLFVSMIRWIPNLCVLVTLIGGETLFRYAIYAAPPLYVFMEAVTGKGIAIQRYPLYAVTALIVVSIIPLVVAGEDGLKRLALTLWPITFIMFNVQITETAIKNIFITLLVFQTYLAISGGFRLDQVDLQNSESVAETHNLPFVFGLFMCIFLVKRNWVFVGLTFLALIIAGKRIALFASIIGILAVFFVSLHRQDRGAIRSPVVFWFAPPLILLFNLFLPSITQAIAEVMDLNEAVFTAGRSIGQYYAYITVTDWRDTTSRLFGAGLGTGDYLAALGWGVSGVLLHNDGLRLFIDYGFVGGILFAYVYASILMWRTGIYGVYLISYVLVLWLSDNTIIYPFFGVCLSLVIWHARSLGRR